MGWTKTDLKASETRSDENGKTEQYEYDALLRLKKVAAAEKETSYEMDGVGNITERVDREKDVTRTADFQVNSRNQVTHYKGQPLSYDLNGNLTQYGDRYVYNWKNQLVRVERASGGEVYFKYDALGRRVEKSTTAGFVKRYLYDGWRVIEERDAADGLLTRYVYGNGLDEAVDVEKDRDGDGTLEGYTPVQNTVGSVVGIADKDGNLVERMDYSAYGAPTFIYDHASPEVDVVRVKDGNILIMFSEPVKKDKAQQAIKVKKGADEISGAMTFEDGDRVVKFVPSSALPQNETLTISISTDLEDLAQNKLNRAFSQSFTYAGLDLIAYDRMAPEVESIRLVSGVIYVEFSEEIDQATITGAVEVSSPVGSVAGAVASTDERTVKFTPTSTITPGITYTVKVKTGVKDLSGKSLSQQVTKTFNTSGSDFIVYQKPDPNHQVASYIGNTSLFQGREYDQETGLYYFRARYLNSELGRFLQPDPKGYVDSMNPYQSFGNNPVNSSDPMGKIVVLKGTANDKLELLWLIKLGLKEDEWNYINTVEREGETILNPDIVKGYSGASINLSSLKELITNPKKTAISFANEIILQGDKYELNILMPGYTFSRELTQGKEGIFNKVVVAKNLPKGAIVGTLAHELLGHAYLEVAGKKHEHEEPGVNKYINDIQRNAIMNFVRFTKRWNIGTDTREVYLQKNIKSWAKWYEAKYKETPSNELRNSILESTKEEYFRRKDEFIDFDIIEWIKRMKK